MKPHGIILYSAIIYSGFSYMESYKGWRVMVYDLIFGELSFFIVTSLNYPNFIKN